MKISLLVPGFSEVTHTWISIHAIGLINAGYDVEIACGHFNGIKHKFEEEYQLQSKTTHILKTRNGIGRLIYVLFRFKNRFKILWSFFKNGKGVIYDLNDTLFKHYFQSNNSEIIHAHFGSQGRLLIKYFDLIKDKKLFVTFHGSDIQDLNDQFQYKLFNKIVTNSRYSQLLMIERGIPQNSINIIPSFYNSILFEGISNLNKIGRIPKIIFWGRLLEYKGIREFLQIAQYFAKKYESKLEFHLIGNGELYDFAESLQLKNLFLEKFLPQELLIKRMNQGDILLYPSKLHNGRAENQGVITIEAQAMGLIPIVSASGGVGEYLVDQVTGFIIKGSNLEDYIRIIEKLANEEILRTKMAKAAIKFAANFELNKLLNEKYLPMYACKS